NSQRSLASSDPVQDPVEPGGQQAWLQQMLCASGSAPGCTRDPHERAVVVANTPSYSYGPGSGSGTASDAASFESTLLTDHASALVAGRSGWNALYYVLAGGVHSPCPGGDYPAAPPSGLPTCGAGGSAAATPSPPAEVSGAAASAREQLADALVGV